jgi:hypothetical protein
MDKFTGSFEELQAKVKACGADGDWTDVGNGHQFRCKTGAKMNWYPSTGKLQYQGSKALADKLKEIMDADQPVPAPDEQEPSVEPPPEVYRSV